MDAWLPRGSCGPWTDLMRETYQWSHLIIGFCYLLIAVMLVIAWREARDRSLTSAWSVLVGSGVFLTCAFGHWLDGFGAFYWPRYDVFMYWHALTAGFALLFMVSLPHFLMHLLRKGADHESE